MLFIKEPDRSHFLLCKNVREGQREDHPNSSLSLHKLSQVRVKKEEHGPAPVQLQLGRHVIFTHTQTHTHILHIIIIL